MATPSLRWLGWFSFLNLYEPERQVKLFDENRSSFWMLMDERVVGGVSSVGLGPLGGNLILDRTRLALLDCRRTLLPVAGLATTGLSREFGNFRGRFRAEWSLAKSFNTTTPASSKTIE
jgi:hypothetical protein